MRLAGIFSHVGLALFLALPFTTLAAQNSPSGKEEPILITADNLVIDSPDNSAVFSGNARAVQGGTVVTADKLTIFMAKDKKGTPADQEAQKDQGADLQNIERIVAEGQVKIVLDDRVATTEKAVYHAAEKKLVLTGPGTMMTSGKDQVVGRMITFYREVGRVECVGD